MAAGQIQELVPVLVAARHHASHRSAGDPSEPVLLNFGQRRAIRGYRRMVQSRKAVISIREDEDPGMVDVCHPQKLVEDRETAVVEALRDGLVKGLLQAAFSCPFGIEGRNLYLNSRVTSRGRPAEWCKSRGAAPA